MKQITWNYEFNSETHKVVLIHHFWSTNRKVWIDGELYLDETPVDNRAHDYVFFIEGCPVKVMIGRAYLVFRVTYRAFANGDELKEVIPDKVKIGLYHFDGMECRQLKKILAQNGYVSVVISCTDSFETVGMHQNLGFLLCNINSEQDIIDLLKDVRSEVMPTMIFVAPPLFIGTGTLYKYHQYFGDQYGSFITRKYDERELIKSIERLLPRLHNSES